MTEQPQGDQQWFEGVYANANQQTTSIPWADLRPNPFLLEWLETIEPDTHNKSAVVVGCGLGDDAEELAQRGYNVTAFDVSATAVDWCRQRFPNSKVDYVVGDLFKLPKDWQFDFVLEINTIQAIPVAVRQNVINAIAGLVAPGGTLLAIGRLAKTPEQQIKRPWPLTRAELHYFVEAGLTELRFDTFGDAEIAAHNLVRFQVTYRR
jgi:2-polyprenyl-3-methyl-5-hydroxy-6-metoxy-1,4-benzoquinol methylase